MTTKMKRFHNLTTSLNFDASSSIASYRNVSTEINFYNTTPEASYRSITTELNYDVDSFDSSFPIYQILLDFLESYTGPDILS